MQKISCKLLKQKIDEFKNTIGRCNIEYLYIAGYSKKDTGTNNLFEKFYNREKEYKEIIKKVNAYKNLYDFLSVGIRYYDNNLEGDHDLYILKKLN